MKMPAGILLLAMCVSISASAEGKDDSHAAHGKSLIDACKTECPAAKTEHEAHSCLKALAKKKKDGKIGASENCLAALKEHEAHEASEKDSHKH